MRNLIRALAFLAMLLPGVAAAQCSSTVPLPINTVLGRLGITPGPCQAIPFNQLAQTLFTNANLTLAGAAGTVMGGSPGAFTATPTLGVASTTTGTLTLANSANSGKVTVGAPSTATNWTFKFPTTAGSNGQSLITDGSGNTSWAAGTGTVNSGTAGQLTYYATTAAAVSGNANLTVSAGALTLGVAGSQAGTLLLAGGTSGATTLAGPASGGGTMTFPAGSDTVMSIAATQTVTNKTLTSPAINTPTITAGTLTALTGLAIRDTSAAFDLTLTATSTSSALTAGRALTLDMGNVAHTVQFGTTANTITFPNVASDTVAMLAAAQSISGKTFTTSTYNGNTWTAGTGTLTIAAGKTLTASNSLTFTGTDGNSFAFPSGSDTVVTLAASQTLTNKVLTAPTINGGTAQALTNLGVRSSGGGAFDMVVNNTETLTAQRALTITLNNAARNLNLSGDLTTAAAFTTAGSGAITLTSTGATNVTLPTSGILAAINIAQTFSSQNIFSSTQQFTDLKFSSGKLYPTSDSATAEQFCKADGTTCFVTVDTTNQALTAATLKFTTLDSVSLASSITTITGLTANNSPSSSNDYLLYFSAADNKIRKCTVGSCAAAATAGVSSLNGLTGGLSVVQGVGITVSAVGTSVTITSNPNMVVQPFTAGAGTYTYTPTTNMHHAVMECVGSGGGGGGSNGTASQTYGAGGGGGGAYSRKMVTAAQVGATATIVIGAAGNGGAAGSNNGTAGSNVTITSAASVLLLQANGGAAGTFASGAQVPSGGAGGTTGTGDIIGRGNPGGNGAYIATALVSLSSGAGGSSAWGGGANGVNAPGNSVNGQNGSNYGAGGSGAESQAATTGAGGNGSAGACFITDFINT